MFKAIVASKPKIDKESFPTGKVWPPTEKFWEKLHFSQQTLMKICCKPCFK